MPAPEVVTLPLEVEADADVCNLSLCSSWRSLRFASLAL